MKRAMVIVVALGLLIVILTVIPVLSHPKHGYKKLNLPPGMALTTMVVPALVIEGPDRAFADPMVQYSLEHDKLVIASMESHLWPEELFEDWRSQSKPDEALWARMPRPTHVWVANTKAGLLEYGDTSSWSVGGPALQFHSIEDHLRERRLRLSEPMLTSKPVWWPDDEIVAGTEAPQYGRVLPGRDALYYIMLGSVVKTDSDIWGSYPVFSGPIRVVIQPLVANKSQLIEYVLETGGVYTHVAVRFDENGDFLLVHSASAGRLWFVDLTELWQDSQTVLEPSTRPE